MQIENIDNLIVSYKDLNFIQPESADTESSPNRIEMSAIKSIWNILENYATQTENRILQLGVADLDEAQFRDLYTWAKIKPNIIQINLASCCVVPPTLQEFCNQNSIQLLTHSDPSGKHLYYIYYYDLIICHF